MKNLPSVSVHCITFGRPFYLEEAIESFLRQDYIGPKEMAIFNDLLEQELVFDHPEIKIINSNVRCPTLGDARNELVKNQNGQIILQLDDDDTILPTYISTCVKLLGNMDWMMPGNAVTLYKYDMKFIENSGSHIVFRKTAWEKVGGYSSMNTGEDWNFVHKLENAKNNLGINGGFPQSSEIGYVYTWGGDAFHRAILSLNDISENKKDSNELVRKLVLKDIEMKRIPSGRIQLIPQWKHDYAGLVNNFLASRSK